MVRMVSAVDHTRRASQFVLRKDFVVTVQETSDGDCLDRAATTADHSGAAASQWSDYLTYVLIDAVIDSYFPVLNVWRRMDVLDATADGATTETFDRLHVIRQGLLQTATSGLAPSGRLESAATSRVRTDRRRDPGLLPRLL